MATRLVVPPNLAGVISKLEGLTGKFSTPLMKQFGLATLKLVDDIFKEGGRPKWQPLAVSTLASKRQGKNKGSSGRPGAMALSGLRHLWEMTPENHRVVVSNKSPYAIYHEYGTKGPYKIEAKNGKALALPFLPGRDKGSSHAERQALRLTGKIYEGKGTAKRVGRYSLAGAGRTSRLLDGRMVYKGGSKSQRFAGREGKTVSPYTNVAFYQSVMHPGLHARPMFPSPEQLFPVLEAEAVAYLHALFAKMGPTGGVA